MNRKLSVSFIARNDLVNIHDYIAERNTEAAGRLMDRLEATFVSLATNPYTGSQVGDAHPGLRFKMVGKYVVYYRITDEEIWIQRVIHSARDTGRLL